MTTSRKLTCTASSKGYVPTEPKSLLTFTNIHGEKEVILVSNIELDARKVVQDRQLPIIDLDFD